MKTQENSTKRKTAAKPVTKVKDLKPTKDAKGGDEVKRYKIIQSWPQK